MIGHYYYEQPKLHFSRLNQPIPKQEDVLDRISPATLVKQKDQAKPNNISIKNKLRQVIRARKKRVYAEEEARKNRDNLKRQAFSYSLEMQNKNHNVQNKNVISYLLYLSDHLKSKTPKQDGLTKTICLKNRYMAETVSKAKKRIFGKSASDKSKGESFLEKNGLKKLFNNKLPVLKKTGQMNSKSEKRIAKNQSMPNILDMVYGIDHRNRILEKSQSKPEIKNLFMRKMGTILGSIANGERIEESPDKKPLNLIRSFTAIGSENLLTRPSLYPTSPELPKLNMRRKTASLDTDEIMASLGIELPSLPRLPFETPAIKRKLSHSMNVGQELNLVPLIQDSKARRRSIQSISKIALFLRKVGV